MATVVWVLIGTSRRKFRLMAGLVLLSIIAAVFWYAFNFPGVLYKSHSLADLMILSRGMSGREVLWPVAIQVIRANPILGVGIGRAWETKFEFGGQIAARYGQGSGYHNFILDTAVMMGLPTAILGIVLIGVSLKRLLRTELDPHLKKVITSGATGMLVASFFVPYNIGGVRSTSFALTALLGLANAAPWLWGNGHSGLETTIK
jgi:O-antigen ligase